VGNNTESARPATIGRQPGGEGYSHNVQVTRPSVENSNRRSGGLKGRRTRDLEKEKQRARERAVAVLLKYADSEPAPGSGQLKLHKKTPWPFEEKVKGGIKYWGHIGLGENERLQSNGGERKGLRVARKEAGLARIGLLKQRRRTIDI